MVARGTRVTGPISGCSGVVEVEPTSDDVARVVRLEHEHEPAAVRGPPVLHRVRRAGGVVEDEGRAAAPAPALVVPFGREVGVLAVREREPHLQPVVRDDGGDGDALALEMGRGAEVSGLLLRHEPPVPWDARHGRTVSVPAAVARRSPWVHCCYR